MSESDLTPCSEPPAAQDAPGLHPELGALLDLLRCPQTGLPLRVATAEECRMAASADGHPNGGPGLVASDGSIFYPIRNGFPILLLDAAIRLTALPRAEEASTQHQVTAP